MQKRFTSSCHDPDARLPSEAQSSVSCERACGSRASKTSSCVRPRNRQGGKTRDRNMLSQPPARVRNSPCNVRFHLVRRHVIEMKGAVDQEAWQPERSAQVQHPWLVARLADALRLHDQPVAKSPSVPQHAAISLGLGPQSPEKLGMREESQSPCQASAPRSGRGDASGHLSLPEQLQPEHAATGQGKQL